MFVQQCCRSRPDDQPCGGRDAGLRHPLNSPFLCKLRPNAQELGERGILSDPFTRRNIVSVGSELDSQVARIHGAAIPLQPEAEMSLPYAVFC
jgi:hypothetical protein